MRGLGFSAEQIRTFVAISKSANLSRAADVLAVTQGAVTQQLNNLERALGLQLVERSGHGMKLTPAGVEVAAACAAAVRELEGIAETARVQRALEVGRLRIGASPTCANHYLPLLLARYMKQWPKVDIQVIAEGTAAIAEQVSRAELDCGLVEGPIEQNNLESFNLYRDTVIAVASSKHPLGRMSHRTAADLRRHRYLGREVGSATESLAQQMLGPAYGVSPRLELTHLDAVKAATLAGLGYAVLPRVAIERDLERGQLVQLPISEKERWITAIRRRHTRVPVIEAFWTVLPARPAGGD